MSQQKSRQAVSGRDYVAVQATVDMMSGVTRVPVEVAVLSVSTSVCPSVCLSVCPSVRLPGCLNVHHFISFLSSRVVLQFVKALMTLVSVV